MNDMKCAALAAKLAKILGEIESVPKRGRNEFHNYDYVTENDLVYAVRKKLSEAKIFVFSSVESQSCEFVKSGEGAKEKHSVLTSVTTKHTFVDGESGEQFSVFSQGQGSDTGDKGGYKAITGAMKYFLYKCFMIPTGDDPESDKRTDERGQHGTTKAEEVRRPSSSSKPQGSSQSKPADKLTDADMKVIEEQESKFWDGRWMDLEIHFGKNKGVPLGKLEQNSLRWYIDEWQPKPHEGRVSLENLILRAALNAAANESEGDE